MESYDAAYAAAASGVSAVYVILSLAISVLTLVAMWKLFVKAGKAGWKCLIPFYNTYCLYDIAWGNGWLFLLMFVPCVNVVVGIMMLFKLAKAFGQGTGFGFGLLFLNTIFILILGFGSAEYVGPQVSAKN
ncbi:MULTISPECIES: DUF5684 domain-containing protein [Suilimivivens]|uniref:DUF5684 domain-containing protein n=1 Tax=Suilimivivens aceti TaxID=2981774 RepID=A0ABT2T7I1_9FIRM|nr:DUF5684 domain-containing protein [Suilimivivens aceti]MCU6745704.1 DUF5684 domain-containing protein [Suilimivivens aceti]SCI30832.1 Uncharacterised protein [uncultured Clostridium sp.]